MYSSTSSSFKKNPKNSGLFHEFFEVTKIVLLKTLFYTFSLSCTKITHRTTGYLTYSFMSLSLPANHQG
jgi:hypothetical protein